MIIPFASFINGMQSVQEIIWLHLDAPINLIITYDNLDSYNPSTLLITLTFGVINIYSPNVKILQMRNPPLELRS